MPGGRPTKFTRELGKACTALAREGKSRHAVAGLIGISHATLGNWLEGKAESIADEDHDEFLTDYEKAEAEVEAARVAVIAHSDQWQSKAWLLERSRKHWRLPKEDADPSEERSKGPALIGILTDKSQELLAKNAELLAELEALRAKVQP